MANIRTQGGSVLTKGGLVSCNCCDSGPPPAQCPIVPSNLFPANGHYFSNNPNLTNIEAFDLPSSFAAAYVASGSWQLEMSIDFSVTINRSNGISYALQESANGIVTQTELLQNATVFASNGVACLASLSFNIPTTGTVTATVSQPVYLAQVLVQAGTYQSNFSTADIYSNQLLFQIVDQKIVGAERVTGVFCISRMISQRSIEFRLPGIILSNGSDVLDEVSAAHVNGTPWINNATGQPPIS